MTDFNVGILIKANAAQAKAELASVADRTKVFGTQTRAAGVDARTTATVLTAYELRVNALEAQLRQLIAAQTEAAAKAKAMPQAFNGGAQSVGNMAAQFNDLTVMLAAGQNPLQLAIQQGTQITQGFGGQGAAGAVKLLKDGFLQMLSPVNIVTIGVIALGAAGVQAFMSMVSGGEAAEDKLRTVADVTRAVVESLDDIDAFNFNTMLGGMRIDAEEIKGQFDDILSVIQQVQQTRLDGALQDMRDQLGLAEKIADFQKESSLLAQIGADAPQFEFIGLDSLNEAKFVMQAIREIEGETKEEILASVEATAEKLYLRGVLTAEVQAYLATVSEELGLSDLIVGKIEQQIEASERVRGSASGTLGVLLQIAAVNINGPFARAEVAANRLYARVGDVLGRMMRMAQQAAAVGGGRGLGPQGPDLDPYGFREQLAADAANADTGGSSGGGGGGGAARVERDAVAELIAKLREEGAIRAELDPVAQQMLRYREQLSTATAAERAEVEALIKVREQEKSMEVLTDYLATNTLDLLKGITRGGDAAAASMKKFANSILDAAMQALILGKGPLADLLGISGNIFQGGGGGKGGGGGLLSGLLGGVAALFGGGGKTKLAAGVGAGGGLKFANGGMVFGAGGGRDDRVPLWGSAGEFMVNARSTAQYRPLLERINAAPGFADGGLIGGGGGLSGAGGGARAININVNVTGANGNAEILDMVHQGVAKGIDIYRREAMPGDVIRVSRNPNERGR